jgi:hypothetical protein
MGGVLLIVKCTLHHHQTPIRNKPTETPHIPIEKTAKSGLLDPPESDHPKWGVRVID